eukprot:g2270.t1
MNDADAFIDSTNTSIVNIIADNCSFEEPWDGFGGLVSIGNSVVFREEGLLTALAAFSSSPSHDSYKGKSSKSRTGSSLGSARSTEGHRIQVTATSESIIKKPIDNQRPAIPESHHSGQSSRPTSSFQRAESCSTYATYAMDRRLSKSRISNARSTEVVSAELYMKQHTRSAPKTVERVISEVEKFKSRLIAVRSEGLPARETMIKCAAIADDAFTLALKKIKSREYSDACLLAAVADSACPDSAVSAKNKIMKLKQSAERKLKSLAVT